MVAASVTATEIGVSSRVAARLEAVTMIIASSSAAASSAAVVGAAVCAMAGAAKAAMPSKRAARVAANETDILFLPKMLARRWG